MSLKIYPEDEVQKMVGENRATTLELLKMPCFSKEEYKLQCFLQDRLTSFLGGERPFKQWVHDQCEESRGTTIAYQCDGCKRIMTKCNGCNSSHIDGAVVTMTVCNTHKKRFCCKLEQCCPQ